MKTRKCLFSTLVMLFALALTPGCGSKDNEAGDENQSTNQNTVTDTVIVDGRESCRTDIYDKDTLKTAVSNMEFIQQNYPIVMYQVMKAKRQGILWTYSNSFMRTSYDGQTSVSHEYGSTKEAIRDELVSKINDSTTYYKIGSGYHRVTLSNGDVYDIDLCSPIVANPLNYYDSSENEYHKVTNWYYRYY